MVDFHKYIARRCGIVQQIAGDACPLRHPVQPDAPAGTIDVVMADDGVNRPVYLDAGHLRPRKQLADMDIMDVVAGDGAEDRPHASHQAGLFAVGNVIVADDMMADVVLRPAPFQSPLNRFDIALRRVRRGIVELVPMLAERDAGADRVSDVVVFDDPALAPVGADQADLLRRGRRPGGGGVPHRKAAYGEVIDAGFFRIEHGAANVHFHLSLVGIDILELRPQGGIRVIHLRKP
ncbi:MAG: hypothetical protein BWY71_01297 [Planctomycetes bacterium ADurb.Bin412]|nr:MAG: hypothetical protein BWY71_01297 [Planctomycetes bacterium ADurb.Bin412]